MRLQNCRHFDTKLLIKNLKDWRKEKKKLMDELASISELPSIENKSGIRGTDISDPTSSLAIRRETIRREIEDITLAEEAYEYGKSQLTEEELEVFLRFFEPKKAIWREIEEYTGSNYICRVNMYKERWKILDKMDELIEKKYFL